MVCTRPVTTPVAEVDLRVGGGSLVVMRMPDGKAIPCPGVYLEIIPNQKLVFTDGYSGGCCLKLAQVKQKYDPTGLFFVHHGVGSEAWAADGFERLRR